MPSFMNAADLVVAPSRNTPHFKEQYGRVVPDARMWMSGYRDASRSAARAGR